MPTRKGCLQGYNAQIAVSADQLIVAVALGQSTNDQTCFEPMMHAAKQTAAHLHALTNNERQPIGTVLADAGYAADRNLTTRGSERVIALGKGRDQSRAVTRGSADEAPPPNATPRQALEHRLCTASGRALYMRRGAGFASPVDLTTTAGGPAAQTGLETGDASIHADGYPITTWALGSRP